MRIFASISSVCSCAHILYANSLYLWSSNVFIIFILSSYDWALWNWLNLSFSIDDGKPSVYICSSIFIFLELTNSTLLYISVTLSIKDSLSCIVCALSFRSFWSSIVIPSSNKVSKQMVGCVLFIANLLNGDFLLLINSSNSE